jgi:hypothetical protein
MQQSWQSCTSCYAHAHIGCLLHSRLRCAFWFNSSSAEIQTTESLRAEGNTFAQPFLFCTNTVCALVCGLWHVLPLLCYGCACSQRTRCPVPLPRIPSCLAVVISAVVMCRESPKSLGDSCRSWLDTRYCPLRLPDPVTHHIIHDPCLWTLSADTCTPRGARVYREMHVTTLIL